MSAELQLVGTVDMSPESVKARINYCRAMAAASLIPKHYQDHPANVLVAVETGMALGIPPVQALQGIAVINGKATLSADLMAAVIRRAGHRLRINEDTDGMSVAAELIRHDDPDYVFRVVWNEDKARRAGLWGKPGPWSQYPLQMMRARAISEVARQGASEVLFGCIYTPEELGANVDADGEVVTVDAVDNQPVPEPRSAPQPKAEEPPSTEPAESTGHESARPAESLNPAPRTITQEQTARALALRAELGLDDYRLARATMWCSDGRTNRGPDLSQVEAARLIAELERQLAARGEQAQLDVVEAEIVEEER